MTKKIAILGSTGSIGVQTLQVIDMFPDKFQVISLSAAGNNKELLEKQILKYKPKIVAIRDKSSVIGASQNTKITYGKEAMIEATTLPEIDIVVVAVTGAVGLLPTFEAIKAGKQIALANKETLVTAGKLVLEAAKKNNVNILPIDSEHSAIFQCLKAGGIEVVRKIILTASGGPFRGMTYQQLQKVTCKEALNHPNWAMGRKISIDSATMMNKGLEVIEARYLFDIDYDRIEVLVHPQSIIHSMVSYEDGSIMANMGEPDMRIPIQYALTYPKRIKNTLKELDLTEIKALTFEKPNFDLFPCLGLAYEAGRKGMSYPIVLNAANEIAVDLFLKGLIPFTNISILVEKTLEKFNHNEIVILEDVIEVDKASRELAQSLYRKEMA